jgi:hypothetical protein
MTNFHSKNTFAHAIIALRFDGLLSLNIAFITASLLHFDTAPPPASLYQSDAASQRWIYVNY